MKKRKADNKPRQVKFRVTVRDLELFQEAAEASGLTLSDWVRMRVWGRAIVVAPRKVA